MMDLFIYWARRIRGIQIIRARDSLAWVSPLEVLFCQHEHLYPLAGAGLVSIPLRRLAQAGSRSPDSASLYCRDTLVTTCSAHGNGKLHGALVYLSIISRPPVR